MKLNEINKTLIESIDLDVFGMPLNKGMAAQAFWNVSITGFHRVGLSYAITGLSTKTTAYEKEIAFLRDNMMDFKKDPKEGWIGVPNKLCEEWLKIKDLREITIFLLKNFKIGLNATALLKLAKFLHIEGKLIKTFPGGQELREYDLPNGKFKIKAFSHEHVSTVKESIDDMSDEARKDLIGKFHTAIDDLQRLLDKKGMSSRVPDSIGDRIFNMILKMKWESGKGNYDEGMIKQAQALEKEGDEFLKDFNKAAQSAAYKEGDRITLDMAAMKKHFDDSPSDWNNFSKWMKAADNKPYVYQDSHKGDPYVKIIFEPGGKYKHMGIFIINKTQIKGIAH